MKLKKGSKSKERTIPSGIYKHAAKLREHRFALIILLDGIPYVEISDSNRERFHAKLDSWTMANLDSLRAPVSCRFFICERPKASANFEAYEHFIN